MVKKYLIIASVLLLVMIAGCTRRSAEKGAAAGDFSLQDMNGKIVTLSEFKGKVVLLEFWATWCPPCRASVPGLEKLHKEYRDKGLVVLAISLDQGDWATVRSFVSEYGITYTVLKGTDEVQTQYQVRTIPMTIILDREGKISKRYLGVGPDEDMEKDLKAYL
jgi:peroxiredoxin